MNYLKIFILLIYSTCAYGQCSYYFSYNESMPKYQKDFENFTYSNPNAPKQGNIVLYQEKKVSNFNPYSLTGILPSHYYILHFDSLAIAPLDNSDILYGLLAKEICYTESKLSITLNNEAKWDKNNPVTYEDIKYTIDYLTKIKHPYYYTYFKNISNIEIKKDAIVFNIEKNFNKTSSTLLAIPILKKGSVEEYKKNKKPIPGSGPYYIENINNSFVYKLKEDYWAKDIPSRKGFFNFKQIKLSVIEKNSSIKTINSPLKWSNLFTKNYLNKNNLKKSTFNVSFTPVFNGFFINTKKVDNIEDRKKIISSYSFEKIHPNYQDFYKKSTGLLSYPTAKVKTSGSTSTIKKNLDIVFTSKEHALANMAFIKELKMQGFKTNVKVLNSSILPVVKSRKNFDILFEKLLFSSSPTQDLIYYFNTNSNMNYCALDSNNNFSALTEEEIVSTIYSEYCLIPTYESHKKYVVYSNKLMFYSYRHLDIFTWWSLN